MCVRGLLEGEGVGVVGCERRLLKGDVGSGSSRGLPIHELNIPTKHAEDNWRPYTVSRSID